MAFRNVDVRPSAPTSDTDCSAMTVPVDLTIQLHDLPALCARQETSTIALTQDDLNAVRSVVRDKRRRTLRGKDDVARLRYEGRSSRNETLVTKQGRTSSFVTRRVR